jgi:hypothetical protein
MGVVRRLWKDKQDRQRSSLQAYFNSLPRKHDNNTKYHHHKPGRFRRAWSRVKKTFTSSNTGATNVDDAPTPLSKKAEHEQHHKTRRKVFENIRHYSKFEMEEAIAGTKLLSGSFQVLSRTAGFVADTVRVSGDTAAGIMGSSVKFFGTDFKSVGTGLSSASRRLDKNSSSDGLSSDTTSTRSKGERDDNHHGNTGESFTGGEQRQKKRYGNLGKHTRRLAAKSVKLVGSVIGGVGESLLIAGVAAESLTSSTAGVAEETVRILENLAGTISMAISLKSSRKHSSSRTATTTPGSGTLRKKLSPYYLSFGTYENPESENRTSIVTDRSLEDILGFMEVLVGDAGTFWAFVTSNVADVPSMAAELLVALLLCHLAAIVLLRQKCPASTEKSKPDNKKSVWSSLRINPLRVNPLHSLNVSENGSSKMRLRVTIGRYVAKTIVLFPVRILWFSLKGLFKLIFNRKLLLLAIYGLIWTNMARLSQERALLIQRYDGACCQDVPIALVTCVLLIYVLLL